FELIALVTKLTAPFPADRLEACYRARVTKLLIGIGDDANLALHLAIRFCHWTFAGDHAPGAGFRAVLDELREMLAARRAPRPTLFLGFQSPARVRGHPDAAVLDWLGADYLRYDATDAELLSTVKRTLAGARTSLPPSLVPTLADILSLASGARHWLDNR